MKKIYEILGVEQMPVSHAEKFISAIGGFVAVLCIFTVSQWFVGAYAAALVVASMGASAILLFAVPHGQLSQPWPIFVGHIVAALIGITCAKLFPNEILAASLAVGSTIIVMYYLRCIHPPGGATALSAVIGGESVHALGYQYVITPVLLNILILLVVGVVFNYMFPWRRYPAFLHKKKMQEGSFTSMENSQIAHEDFVYALSEIDSFIDISEHDLLRIYDLATKKSQTDSP